MVDPPQIRKKRLSEPVDMSRQQTKGQMEAQIAAAITQFEREHLGRGPTEVRTWVIQDLILVRLKGVLTPAEQKLARHPKGHRLIKEVRRQLLDGSRFVLDEMIQQVAGLKVVALHKASQGFARPTSDWSSASGKLQSAWKKS